MRRAPASPITPSAPIGDVTVILRRNGLRPLRFDGHVLLAEEDTADLGWYSVRLAVYVTDVGDFVTEILCVPGDKPGARPWGEATRVCSLADAVAHFETAQPQAEPEAMMTVEQDATALLLHCVDRLGREAAQKHAMQHAIGGFLYRLCEQFERPPTALK